jgi:hypothetical protein
MRNLIVVGAFFTLSLGLVFGAEYRGILNKVEGDKITFTTMKKGEKGDPKTLPAAASVKVLKSKFNPETKKAEAGDPLEGGLKNEAVKEGAFVTIITDADDKHITEIRVGGGRKKKE